MNPDRLIATAAIFETEFSIDWLLELSGKKATEVLELMKRFVGSRVLTETQTGWFRFKSRQHRKEYSRELSRSEVRSLQRQIKSILLRDWQQDEKYLNILLQHMLKIPNDLKDCQWLVDFAGYFEGKGMHEEAVRCLVKAVDELQTIKGEAANALLIKAAGHYFSSARTRSESDWSAAVLTEMIERTKTRGDQYRQAIFHMYLAGNQWQQAITEGFHEHFNKARDLMDQIDDPRYIRNLESFCVTYYTWQGLNREAVETYERLVQDIDSLPDDHLPLYASTMAAWANIAVGNLNQGLGMLDAISSHSLKINRPDNYGFAVYYIAEALYSAGRLNDVRHLLDSIDTTVKGQLDSRIRQDIGLLKALVQFEMGEIEKSRNGLLEYLDRSFSLKAFPYSSYEFLLKFCWAIETGEYSPVDGLNLEDVIESGFLKLNVHFESLAYRYKALMLNRREADVQAVLSLLKRSLEYAEKSGYLLSTAAAHIELARVYLQTGETGKARKSARQAMELMVPYQGLAFPSDLKFLVQDLSKTDNLLAEILQLSQSMSTIRNSDDIIKQIILTVTQITGAERSAIFLLKGDGSDLEFELRAAKNLTLDNIRQDDFSGSMELIRKTVESREGFVRKIAMGHPDKQPANQIIRSCACIPMLVKNKSVGVLYFDNHYLASSFRKKDLGLFSFFASQAAIAIDNADLYSQVKRLNQKLDKENRYYREEQRDSLRYKNFIGESEAIRAVLHKIEKVAQTDTVVLVTGETGVGKELVAATIMANSTRSDQPFIRVNCTIFSDNLIASELFGHEKGAFTGADRQRAGRFELAHNGTLFLDEIGDIPQNMQMRLLRVLQTKEFERVGGTQTLKSNFRLLAATNQDLSRLVREGRFREDLYFRLNVFPVHVPALRERKEDIPYLAHFFLREYARKLGKPLSKILDSEMEKMLSYHWPGNVRELQNIIERGVVLSSGSVFRVPELKAGPVSSTAGFNGKTLAEMEREHILAALEKASGKISGPGGAAEILGLHHNTLRSKMAKLGIQRQNAHH